MLPQAVPDKKKEYIHLPFPPSYLEKMAAILTPKFKYQKTTTYSKSTIAHILNIKEVQVDIPRDPWAFGQSEEEVYFATAEEVQSVAATKGITLGIDESEALLAFGHSSSGGWSQGGTFSFLNVILFKWLNELTQSGIGSKKRVTRIIKEKKDDPLSVMRDGSFTQLVDGHYQYPIEILYHSQHTIEKEEKEGKEAAFTCKMDSQHNEVKIEKACWEQHILPAAFKRLAESKFKSEELYLFVPFLGNKDFAKAFADKLASKLPDEDKLKEINDAIHLCFNVEPPLKTQFSFWERNGRKILSSLAFGTAMGILFFVTGMVGLLTAILAGLVAGVIGGIPIGNSFDKQHVFSLFLIQLRSLLELPDVVHQPLVVSSSKAQSNSLSPLLNPDRSLGLESGKKKGESVAQSNHQGTQTVSPLQEVEPEQMNPELKKIYNQWKRFR